MSRELVLDVRGLCVRYGEVQAVGEIDLEVAAGEIVTLIGPNGAGKSTTLAAIMGTLKAAAGDVRFACEEVTRMNVEDRVIRGMTLVPESRALFSQMSVEDNLLMGAFCRHQAGHRDHQDSMAQVYQTFPRLQERRRQEAGTLSGGERQMLAIGRALMAKPRLLMLDEPSLGLAPIIVQEIFEIVAGLRGLGVSVLLVEQNARAALRITDRGYVLELGKITLAGDSKDLAGDPRVAESYLGIATPATSTALY